MKVTYSEADFTAQVIEMAQLRGWRAAHFRTVRVQRKDGSYYYTTPVQGDADGFPDLILVRGKVQLAVELKVGRGATTPEQDAWLDAFDAVPGSYAFVWHPKDWTEIEHVLLHGPGVD